MGAQVEGNYIETAALQSAVDEGVAVTMTKSGSSLEASETSFRASLGRPLLTFPAQGLWSILGIVGPYSGWT